MSNVKFTSFPLNVGRSTPDRESLRNATGPVPQQCVDEGEGSHPPSNGKLQDTKFMLLCVHSEELRVPDVCEQHSDDNVESDHLVGGKLTTYIHYFIFFIADQLGFASLIQHCGVNCSCYCSFTLTVL